ncbi:MAG TPA: glycosyl hydrolase family 8 [Oligoflexia bacterium]|nr:glycosyl hydrolase family 8 [Oligoflexia bacterium]HMP48697.1 glycosyl hydrolase family 8 [Oligoflexia bacterium]
MEQKIKIQLIKYFLFFIASLIIGLILSISIFRSINSVSSISNNEILSQHLWNSYKSLFITQEGRVIRPLNDNDTVSEGQSYAMLRAVWMGDKEIFDNCYTWTEYHLKRSKKDIGDTLLAWHWNHGSVIDWMPASDADIDYALSLILADRRFIQHEGGKYPDNVMNYKDRALEILADISIKLIRKSTDGEIFLSPWIETPDEPLSVNLSYYSPAHFQVFYEFTGNPLWMNLKKQTYQFLNIIASRFNGNTGSGLFPDWAMFNDKGEFINLPGRESNFGWESVRIPFRLYLDYLWFGEKLVTETLSGSLYSFILSELRRNNRIFSEYNIDGSSTNPYESSSFYSAYSLTSRPFNTELADQLLDRTKSYIVSSDDLIFFEDPKDYYRNSISWIPFAERAGLLRYKW